MKPFQLKILIHTHKNYSKCPGPRVLSRRRDQNLKAISLNLSCQNPETVGEIPKATKALENFRSKEN